MTLLSITLVASIGISTIVALMLGVAWHDLGRPRHARTWAVAFGLAAIMWTLALASGLQSPLGCVPALIAGIAGFATAAIATGFRQRAGLPDRRRTLFGLAGVHALVVLGGITAWPGHHAWIPPLAAFNAAMFWLASRTLHGRRKGERAAERVAEAALVVLALLNVLVLGGIVGMAAGVLTIDLARLAGVAFLLLPAMIAGIGLFTIILLTADLADQTRRLVATDMLTGLLNRRGFEEAARAIFVATRREGRPMALVMIDVDHFKTVNDRFGHPAGDRVLRSICTRIAQGIGRRDVFARVGGEEFALILVDVDLLAADCAAEVLRAQVEAMTMDLPEDHVVTASFGIAAPEGPDDDLAALFGRADAALYQSKADGRNRVTVAPSRTVSETAAR